MIKFVCTDGLQYLRENHEGFVLTDPPKHGIAPLLALCELTGTPVITAYAKKWLMNGKYPGEKEIGPYRAIIRAFPAEFLIVDPFLGSGCVGIAAILENRDFIGIERDPERLNYAKRRIENTAAGLAAADFCAIP